MMRASALLSLRFAPAGTTQAYMEVLEEYLEQQGRPVSLYSDKHSVFRVNLPDCEGELARFTRVLKTLGIESIHANTPQAKGRVGRIIQTLQNRLVKTMRLESVSDMETANAWLRGEVPRASPRRRQNPRTPTGRHRITRRSRRSSCARIISARCPAT